MDAHSPDMYVKKIPGTHPTDVASFEDKNMDDVPNNNSNDGCDGSRVHSSVRFVPMARNGTGVGALEISFASPIIIGATTLAASGKVGIRFIEDNSNAGSFPGTLDVEMCTTELSVVSKSSIGVNIRNSYGSGETVTVNSDRDSTENDSATTSPTESMNQSLEEVISQAQADLEHETEKSIFQCMSESGLTVVRNRIHGAARAFLLPPETVSRLLHLLDTRMHAMISAAIIQQPKSAPRAIYSGRSTNDSTPVRDQRKSSIHENRSSARPLKGALIKRNVSDQFKSNVPVEKGSWWKRTIAAWKDDLALGSNAAAECKALTETNTKKNAQVVEQDVHTSTGIYHELTRTYSSTVNMFANPLPVYTLVRQSKKRGANRKSDSDGTTVTSNSPNGVAVDVLSVSSVPQPSWLAKLLPKLSTGPSSASDDDDVPWWEAPMVVNSTRAVNVRFRDTVDICDLEDWTTEDEDEYTDGSDTAALDAVSVNSAERNNGMELGFLFSLPETGECSAGNEGAERDVSSDSEVELGVSSATSSPTEQTTQLPGEPRKTQDENECNDMIILSPPTPCAVGGDTNYETTLSTALAIPGQNNVKMEHHTSQLDITPITNSSRSVLGDIDDGDVIRKVGKELHVEIAELDMVCNAGSKRTCV